MNTLQIIQKVFGNNDVSEKWLEKQYAFAKEIRMSEREECAKIAEWDHIGIAATIRARGQA